MKTLNRPGQKTRFAIITTTALLSLRCTAPDLAGGNTSTVDNKVCGVIYDTYGKPAGNATVVMRLSDYIPHNGQLGKRMTDNVNSVCSTRTDRQGKFRFTNQDSIPAGKYCIEVRDSIDNCLLIRGIPIDSAFLKSDASLEIISPRYDTKLKPPSTIRGTIPSLGDSMSGKVFVYGLDNYAIIDRSGGFVLENIPAGDHWLKIDAVGNGTPRNNIVFVITRPADTATVSSLPTDVPDSATIEIDATRAYQTIDGFGASSAWIDNKITPDLAAIFWKDDTLNGHIGLSILRTRIDPGGYTVSEASSMKKAMQANPDMILWSTSWTPPPQFKDNNNLIGGHMKSDSASMQGYADFLVNYVKDVKKNTGIDLYAVSCQNEPDTAGPTLNGCLWTAEQFRVFLKDYWGPAFKQAKISARRMIGESAWNDLTISDPSLADTASATYVDIIGTHLYFGGPQPYPLADSLHKPYWTTETSGLNGVDTSIANALMWANRIHDCLVRCNMSAFHYWWLVNMNNGNDEGLCGSNSRPTPRMYTLGNFSKFIRPGFVRIAATDSPADNIRISAYYGRSWNRLVIVAINSGAETKCTITISGIPAGATAIPWVTDRTHRLERLQPMTFSDQSLTYTLPYMSVVTFVLEDIAYAPN